MKTPWTLPRDEHRSVVLDPCAKLAIPAPKMSDDDYQRLFDARVARNERRRLEADMERLVFLARQAE